MASAAARHIWPYRAGVAVLVVVTLQLIVLASQLLSRPRNGEPIRHAAPLVENARRAFSESKDDLGVALLAAGLMVTPDDEGGLDLYRRRLSTRFENALKDKEWDVAEVQIAAYDSALRDALQTTSTPEAVERLVGRREQLKDWDTQLQRALEAEIDEIQTQLQDPQADQLPGLEQRVTSIPANRLDDVVRRELAAVARELVRFQDKGRLSDFQNRLANLESRAKAETALTNDLRILQVEAERLHADVVEYDLDGGDAEGLLGRCRSLLAQLDQRLQVRSVREMQMIADVEGRQALEAARVLYGEAQEFRSDRNRTWQSAGEKLVAAELQLARIDRLASLALMEETRALAETIKKDSLVYRANQQRRYNLWAIQQLEESIGDFRKAQGILNDNEDAFMEILENKIGQIDPQHLHPVTHSLFSEMYQKLIAELDNDSRVEITRAIESADRKPLSDF